eukprot:CAMPEP_0115308214 /NCGR_PEP_ID=MMETSP0270-20121206/73579_1 /TAXON_ID=71861 /ORGANISM="Scrippsiella trochoidea, Strain CCMP3099" /LENGTH=216 /DNA_ID=CAMNT_0002726757 /DNA_START=1 /DNA_END=648 /DNA_ORIENTATION=+
MAQLERFQYGFRLEELFDTDLREKLYCWWSLHDSCCLECTSRPMCNTLQQGAMLERFVCRELMPMFHVPIPAQSNSETRKAAWSMISNLRVVKVPGDSLPLTLSSFSFAQRLAACVARARAVVARHRADHGGGVEIVVANFCFGMGATLDSSSLQVSSAITATLCFGGQQQVWELKLGVRSKTRAAERETNSGLQARARATSGVSHRILMTRGCSQ